MLSDIIFPSMRSHYLFFTKLSFIYRIDFLNIIALVAADPEYLFFSFLSEVILRQRQIFLCVSPIYGKWVILFLFGAQTIILHTIIWLKSAVT